MLRLLILRDRPLSSGEAVTAVILANRSLPPDAPLPPVWLPRFAVTRVHQPGPESWLQVAVAEHQPQGRRRGEKGHRYHHPYEGAGQARGDGQAAAAPEPALRATESKPATSTRPPATGPRAPP